MSFEACAALVERSDPDRFRATMAAPISARRILFPLYAFNVEVTRAPWVTQEAMIAEMRLQWWRDALEEIGQRRTVRKHEVVDELAGVMDVEAVQNLDGLVASRRWDVYKDAFENTEHFEDYISSTSGNLMWTAARLLGVADEIAVRDFAYAAGVAALFRAIPTLEEAGRKPLLDGTAQGVRDVAQGALNRWKRAKSQKHAISKAAAPALWSGFRARPVLEAVIRNPGLVAHDGLHFGPARESLRFANVSLLGWWR